MKKLIPVFIVTILLLGVGCFNEWYPIYDDFLSTINIDGTDLNYIRNSYGYIMLSPDRTKLVEFSNNKFYSVDLNDLSYRVLFYDFGDNSSIYDPVLYNQKILYLQRGDIYSYDLEDKNITRLTYSGSCRKPALSEDGSKIVYSTTIWDSLSSITIMNSDGSNPNTIIEYNTADTVDYTSYISIRSFRFVMDDQVIFYGLYSTSNLETPIGLYSINIDGSNNQCLVEDVYIWYMTLSPERDYLLFTENGYIHKINADGTNHILLVESGNDNFDPSISPDGEKILFAYEGYPYIMNADGNDRYQLVDAYIGSSWYDLKESYFLDNYRALLIFEKQIN